MIDKEYEESPEGLRERISELEAELATTRAAYAELLNAVRVTEEAVRALALTHANLATARAELDRIHGVVLEMHNAARGEIYTKGAAAGAWAETVNRLGFSADAKRGATP